MAGIRVHRIRNRACSAPTVGAREREFGYIEVPSNERTHIKDFEFEDAGRRYSCTVVERKGALAGSWWWFTVSGDMQSYAPFQAAKDDTRASVQQRVVEYYTNRLFRLTQPTLRGSHWSNRSLASKPAPAATVEPSSAPSA